VVDAVSMEHTRTGDGPPPPFTETARRRHRSRWRVRRIQQLVPSFPGSRTLSKGHVFRPEVHAPGVCADGPVRAPEVHRQDAQAISTPLGGTAGSPGGPSFVEDGDGAAMRLHRPVVMMIECEPVSVRGTASKFDGSTHPQLFWRPAMICCGF